MSWTRILDAYAEDINIRLHGMEPAKPRGFTPAVLDRDAPLEIYGPPGTKRMTGLILYDVRAQDVKPGVVYKDVNITIKAFAVKHGSWKDAYGYRFETADRTIVISGDTAPAESIVEACKGCDVLIHEVYSMTGFASCPPEWQRYHSSFHTSSKELAEIATKARPKQLVLYHQLLWGATKEQLLEEIGKGYQSKVVFANDLDVY